MSGVEGRRFVALSRRQISLEPPLPTYDKKHEIEQHSNFASPTYILMNIVINSKENSYLQLLF